jgi:large subunit ribosomal protein L11
VTRAQIAEIAKTKKEDMNASSPEQAMKVIAGTARSMGIEVVD